MRAGVCQVCVRSSLCALRRSSAPQMEAQCGLAKRQLLSESARGMCTGKASRALVDAHLHIDSGAGGDRHGHHGRREREGARGNRQHE